MKYYIDFEATQFTNEIISVGCVSEKGEEFYSLVAPTEGKITPFITNLTGITEEMIKDAMSPDIVFESFYDWVFNSDEAPEFYVWGDSDITFIRHTFKHSKSIKARLALGYLRGGAMDYCKIFCKMAKLENCSLIRAYNKLVDKEKEQNHNALDDAILLFNVYKAVTNTQRSKIKDIMNDGTVERVVKKENLSKWSNAGFPVGTVCIVNKHKVAIDHWDSIEEAALWVKNNKIAENQRERTLDDNIKARIKGSVYNGRQYFGYTWRIVC